MKIITVHRSSMFSPGDRVMIAGELFLIYKIRGNKLMVDPNWIQRRLLALWVLARRFRRML